MKLTLFVDTVSDRFLCFPTSRIELAAPTLTRGDKIPVELRFVAYGVEVAPPAAAKLGVGTIGNLCALTTAWTAEGNALTGVLDLDTLELATLLGDAPKLYDATLELEYVDAGNTRTVSRSCTIKNDLIRTAPAVLNPASPGGTVDLTPITQRLDAIDSGSGQAVIAAQIAAVKAQASGAKDTLVALNEFLGGYAGQEPVITVITTAITALDAFAANPAPVKADLDAIVAGMSGLSYPPGLRGNWEWNSDTDDRIGMDSSVAIISLNSAGTTLDAVNTVGAALGSASALAAIETLIIDIKLAASNTASSLASTESQINNLNANVYPLITQIADKAPLRRRIVPVYASRELNGDLFDSYVRVNSETDVTLTIPPWLWAGDTAGPEIDIMRAGAGSVTFAAGEGVTINSAGGKLSIATQFASVSLKHVVGNTWDLVGDLS